MLHLRDMFGTLRDRLALGGLSVTAPTAPYGHDFSLNVLHVDDDAICPRCLHWIGPEDIVRRTAYGPAQHEACPREPVGAGRR